MLAWLDTDEGSLSGLQMAPSPLLALSLCGEGGGWERGREMERERGCTLVSVSFLRRILIPSGGLHPPDFI